MTESQCHPEAGSNRCEINSTMPKEKTACPTNQQIGKSVDLLTVKALLALPLTQLPPDAYHFCRASDCHTVYYSADGTSRFNEDDLREKVYQKHPNDDDVLVCYCFRHTVGSIRKEIEKTGASSAITAITNGIKAEQCACEIRNPDGGCCLGNVRATVRRLTAKTGPHS
jgi:hypothetical protein